MEFMGNWFHRAANKARKLASLAGCGVVALALAACNGDQNKTVACDRDDFLIDVATGEIGCDYCVEQYTNSVSSQTVVQCEDYLDEVDTTQDTGGQQQDTDTGGVTSVDADGDGFANDAGDCDDANAAINPNATEVCDSVDNDCDGTTDEDGGTAWYIDYDGDGYGSSAYTSTACAQPSGYVSNSSDCDDTTREISPAVTEMCDDVDNDCDGTTDEDDADDAPLWYEDLDSDGFGTRESWTTSCEQPEGHADNDDDCDDESAAVNPDATEVCDDVDNDCDGDVDVNATDARTWYVDADSDGYGTTASTDSCDQPTGYVALATDCDDTQSSVHPAAQEYCDGEDDDCDGVTDEDDAADVSTWYLDRDGDGFGLATTTDVDCDAPSGYVATSGDCNDSAATAFPGGTEVCDSLDNDCDGTADDNATDATEWYADDDGDSYGDRLVHQVSCSQPGGYVADSEDCDDSDDDVHPDAVEEDCTDPTDYNCDGSTGYADADRDGVPACEDCNDASSSIKPGADEYCDGIDNDCDGRTDTTDAVDADTWYADDDGDSYGDPDVDLVACDAPSGYVADDSDCDDGDDNVNPGAAEVCDASDVDEDCDGDADDEDSSTTGETTWYLDADGDGFGSTSSLAQCEQPSGYESTGGDCRDTNDLVYPGATEYANGVDDDCDGATDE